MEPDSGYFDSVSHMRSYHILAGKVQPGQDRKLTAALFVLSMLPKQGVIRQSLSQGRINFDSIAEIVKDRDLVFFARDLVRFSAGDSSLYIRRLKKKYQDGAKKAIQLLRGEIPLEELRVKFLPAMIGTEGKKVLEVLIEIAERDYDGHFSLLKFTTNWRCCFGTVSEYWHIEQMAVGKTMEEAIQRCIDGNVNVFEFEDLE